MIRYFVHRDGRTEHFDRLDPSWLSPAATQTAASGAGAGVIVWADVHDANEDDARILREQFGLHELPVEAALQRETHPKVESYGKYLYIVLHGINFQAKEHTFETTETDFFLAPNFLVTIHDGQRRSIKSVAELCSRAEYVLGEGTTALLHRIVDAMVDGYRPEIDEIEARLDEIEKCAIENPTETLTGDILDIKRDITALRRIVIPQRDVVGRLARREFDLITTEMSYRFRDVYDQLAHFADDAVVFHDRVTGIFDAYLASVSNRLASVSTVLAVIAALFGPMTVITGLFGMNVPLPSLLGNPQYQFWEVIGMMVLSSAGLFVWFRKMNWL